MKRFSLTRRRFLSSAALGASGMALAGCDAFDALSAPDNAVRDVLEGANDLTWRAQRLLGGRHTLAQEFSDRVVGLKAGRVAFDGTPQALTPTVLTDIYGEEDWNRTIRAVDDEQEQGEGARARIRSPGARRRSSGPAPGSGLRCRVRSPTWCGR